MQEYLKKALEQESNVIDNKKTDIYYLFHTLVSQPKNKIIVGCSNRTRFARLVAYAVFQK